MRFESIKIPGLQGQAEIVRQLQEPTARKAVLILPGRNYDPDRSPLELLSIMALSHGYEVLGLRYSFRVSPYSTESLGLDDLEREVAGTLPHLSRYEEICLVGKSLGTSMARRLLPKLEAPQRSLLLLTPLPDAVEGDSPVDRLALIGDADPIFPRVTAHREAHPAEWRVYPGADHSLQVAGDWRATAQLWQAVVAEAEAFLTRRVPRGCSPHWTEE